MYAYPPPQKVKWAKDDPRLPDNLAQEYVKEKAMAQKKKAQREQQLLELEPRAMFILSRS